MPTTTEQSIVSARAGELRELSKLQQLLDHADAAQLVGLAGVPDEQVHLPEAAFDALRTIVRHLAHGQAVALVPMDEFLSTQQAADILQISRPSLVQLLERGEIPFQRSGVHRRVHARELLAYERRRYIQRRRALDETDEIVQADGEYA
jgi:excisionase family DNA binding protein